MGLEFGGSGDCDSDDEHNDLWRWVSEKSSTRWWWRRDYTSVEQIDPANEMWKGGIELWKGGTEKMGGLIEKLDPANEN